MAKNTLESPPKGKQMDLMRLGSKHRYKSEQVQYNRKEAENLLSEALNSTSSPANTPTSPIDATKACGKTIVGMSNEHVGSLDRQQLLDRVEHFAPKHPVIDAVLEFLREGCQHTNAEKFFAKNMASMFDGMFEDGEGHSRHVLNQLSLSTILEINEHLPSALEKAKQKQRKEREAKIEMLHSRIQQMAVAEGIPFDELMNSITDNEGVKKVKRTLDKVVRTDSNTPKSTREKRMVTHRCYYADRYWYLAHGCRVPKAFKAAMKVQGKTMDDYLLPTSEMVPYDPELHDSKMTGKYKGIVAKDLGEI
ncbi:hypothetical protein [Ferrimonas balearica]|uniref:hypothetical protein n=1 Tax=Ferrimonas balearica TaxID=44012 RepID=UPI001F3BFE37|nr:hypothetical protein [Ferrimonas balearica]MBY6093822.1 hypothetical protein [Ferrimonas balearica]